MVVATCCGPASCFVPSFGQCGPLTLVSSRWRWEPWCRPVNDTVPR